MAAVVGIGSQLKERWVSRGASSCLVTRELKAVARRVAVPAMSAPAVVEVAVAAAVAAGQRPVVVTGASRVLRGSELQAGVVLRSEAVGRSPAADVAVIAGAAVIAVEAVIVGGALRRGGGIARSRSRRVNWRSSHARHSIAYST